MNGSPSSELSQLVIAALLGVGVFFTVVSSIGIVRLPDIYARMHAAGKASTLGVACILLAAGLHFGGWVLFRMLILVGLFLITGPIATTAMARAAYRTDARRSLILNHDELASAESPPAAPVQR